MTSATVHPYLLRSVRNLLSAVRIDEVCVLQGVPIFGALFAAGPRLFEHPGVLLLLLAGSALLTAHVFVLNDWSGLAYDIHDPNRSGEVFAARGTSGATMAFLSIGLLLGGLALLGATGKTALLLGGGIALLSALYSLPGTHWKGIPIAGSLLHICGGLLHFLLGYCAFAPLERRGIALGSYFALVFVAGHLTHETRDSGSDAASGVRTNAVAFGKRRAFLSGVVSFALAEVLLAVLVFVGAAPRPLAILLALFPLHAYWSMGALRAGLTFEAVRSLQWRYRALFAAKGFWMAAVLIIQR